MKRIFMYLFKRSSVAFVAVCLLFGFAACNTDAGDAAETIDIVLPPAAEREVLTENDTLGKYIGMTATFMNGKREGDLYRETVTIGKSSDNKITFVSGKTEYGNMPVDLSYAFAEITLTQAQDGKSFSFNGTKGVLRMYAKHSSPGEEGRLVSPNTAVKGFVYKKAGQIYISYVISYDMADIGDMMPADHKTLSSVVEDAVRQ
ncbi:hypothetical protein [Treponema sp. Marseille-Q4132]|uniref:hypothetical protein n=1 Tax=Treponema sp. Marseille-Q4132 TaxID=2766701 RepID=UPI0016530283|nr:hypothetical protein [Treponema sp. Marseille-Q4132]QNL96313.1 hypothetical protein H9I35_07630 [Treponema sp. Marseille-Q4132]